MLLGMICLWYGTILVIPDGWQLCDGTNGTPDLRNRFVVGAGDTYAQNDSGGTVDHAHEASYTAAAHFLAGGTDIPYAAAFNSLSATSADTFETSTDEHLPPYFALSYIQKM